MATKYNVDAVFASVAEIPGTQDDWEEDRTQISSTSERSRTNTTETPIASSLNYDIPQFDFNLDFESQTQ